MENAFGPKEKKCFSNNKRRMPQFQGKNIFVTITNIKACFNVQEGEAAVKSVFAADHREAPWFAWEKSTESNAHIHIVYMLKKSKSFSRRAFLPLLALFETKALNIQTFSRKQTYKEAITGKTHKGKPDLWLFEKLAYCSLPEHEEYFPAGKLAKKKPTVVKCVSNLSTEQYTKLKAGFDAFMNAKVVEQAKKPADEMFDRIYEGMDLDELMDIYGDKTQSRALRKYILENWDKLTNMIETHQKINDSKRLQEQYPEAAAGYRPFQKELTEILDNQNDRHIQAHIDGGNTGKNFFCSTENMREDTCVIQSAKTADIAYVWNPKKHKRIIIDVPRGKMEYLNTSAIEKLKNGQIMSTKYKPRFKQSFGFKPSILILGNESLAQDTWTSDRLQRSWTHKDIDFELRNGAFETEYLLRASHDPNWQQGDLSDDDSEFGMIPQE